MSHDIETAIANVTWGMNEEAGHTYAKKIKAWVSYAHRHDIDPTYPTLEDVKAYLGNFKNGSSQISVRTILVKFLHEYSKLNKKTDLLPLVANVRSISLDG